MKETLSIFVTIIVFVLLIVIFPLYNYFERQDDMSYNLVLKATTGFIDEVINCGYIDQDMYTDYIFELTSTGNLYDIQLEGHKKILVKADGSNEYKEQYVIDYNDDIFSDQVTNTSNINDRIIKDGVYRLEEGDKIYVKVVNSSTTVAEALINSIVPRTTQKNIRINYGGIVQNNIWKQADSPVFEEFGIKLSFNLNTNGDNNAVYNNDDLKNGITHTIHTGTKYTTITIPNATPTRPNCTFKGWATNKNATSAQYAKNSKIKIDTSTVLYAIWQFNTITLTLNGNGGTPETATKNLTYGSTYTPLAVASNNPTRTGYNFDGWYTDATGGTKITSSTTVTSTNNVTLYAHWKAQSMTVTLNANGGSVSPTSFTATYNEKYGTLPTPTRDGYEFKGWYLDTGYTKQITADSKVTQTGAHTLYAKWQGNTYTVAYKGPGATGGSTTNSTHTYGTAKNLTANGFTRKYTVTYNHNYSGSTNTTRTSTYTFRCWNTAENGSGTSYSDKQSVINLVTSGTINLYAQWNSASVSYTPTRTGYTFNGWYKEAACTNLVTTGAYTPTANITLYAKWTANTSVLTVNPNGGKVNNNTSSFTVTRNINSTYGLTVNTYPNAYTVTYNGNGGNSQGSATTKRTSVAWTHSGGGSISGSTFTFGTTNATVTASYSGTTSVSLPSTSRDATNYCTYTFNGWYNATSGGTRIGGTGSTYTPGSSITLYAQWGTNYKTGKLDHGFSSWLNVHSTSSESSSVVGYVGKNTQVTVYNYDASTGYYYISNVWDDYHDKYVSGWIWEGAITFN